MEIANKGDAHNVYIQIFGHYGIISLCLYVVLNIYILIMIFRKRRKIEYINFFLNYFIVSMFENILLTDTKIVIYNILFLVYVGKLLRDDTGTLKNENEDYLNIIKNIYNKIKDFISFLDNNEEFATEYIPVGDKIAISKRRSDYE